MNWPAGLRLSGILLWTLALNVPAMGQQNPPERGPKALPADERRRELDLSPALPLDRTPVLPPASFAPERGLAAVDHIYVQRIVVEGVTLLGEKEVAEIVAPYQRRRIEIEELYALRRELSAAYVRRGYVNSGVVIPDQQVVDGVVVMQEVRGSVTKIDVTGNGRLSPGYITKRITAATKSPLRVQDLQQALESLQQDPLIQRVNAQLKPGLRPGEAELSVDLKRTQPFQLTIGANNQGSASTGSGQGILSIAELNLTGRGDALAADAGMSGGQAIGSLSYSFPLTASNAKIQAAFSLDNAHITEQPFNLLDIKSRTKGGGLFLLQPLLSSSTQSLVSTVGIGVRQSESTLLGIPFSFSPGDQAGKSKTTDVSAGVEYTVRTSNQALAVRGSIRRGVDLFNATINGQPPDGRFTAFLGQLNYARRLGSFGGELLFRWMGQFAGEPLLALEKMPLGGLNSVRGYRENLFVRDNGQAVSVECRVPVRLGRSQEGRFDALNLRVAPFLDYGRSWDKDKSLSTSTPQDIYSAGVGLLWNPISGFRADLYWGHALKDEGPNSKQSLHFTVQYMLPF
jgi:hemolysin activation/secretion protein